MAACVFVHKWFFIQCKNAAADRYPEYNEAIGDKWRGAFPCLILDDSEWLKFVWNYPAKLDAI